MQLRIRIPLCISRGHEGRYSPTSTQRICVYSLGYSAQRGYEQQTIGAGQANLQETDNLLRQDALGTELN